MTTPKKARGRPRTRTVPGEQQPQPITDMPVIDTVDAPSQNGHQNYPPGNAQFYGVDDLGGGREQSPALMFMTAHYNDTARLLAEAVLDDDIIYETMHTEVSNMARRGYIDMTAIVKMKIAATIGKDGRGRDDGVKVETMGASSIMQRMRGRMGRMFGLGGNGDMTTTPTGQQGPGM